MLFINRLLLSFFFLTFSFVLAQSSPLPGSLSIGLQKNTSSNIFLVATDAENDPITFAIASQPANGTVSLTGSYVVYTPTTDYVGTDSFTFTASDGSLTSSATTVSLTVFNSFLSAATRIGQQLDGESTSDYFGQSVATSQDGSRVVIGIYNDDGGNYSNSGAVKVYEKTTTSTSTTWVQLGVTIEGTANSQHLGRAVAMSPDGNTIFMRADGSNTHVYRWINSAWVQLGGAINHTASQYNSLSSNFDGSNIAIASDTQVEVYQYVNASWSIKGATINQESSSDYSNAVALSADGNTLAIGAYQNDGGGSDSGHVRIFGFENGAWIQLGTDIDGDGAGDHFGISVSLSADGSTLAVGARYYDTNTDNNDNRGSVQIYSRSLTETSTLWTQKGETLTGIANSDYFGSDTTLSADGNILAVGAYNSNVNSSYSGQVTLYHWKNSAWEALGSRIDGPYYTQTGYSIALSSDGTKLVVGSPYHNSQTGYVTVYELADYQNDVPQVQAIVSATEKNTSSNIFLVATDAENDPITFAIASQPANGTVSLTGSYVVYTPTTDYVGTDSFTFTASDGSLTSSATTVSLTVFNSFLSAAARIGQQLDGESTSDYFGQSVATSQDGSRVVIGIYNDDGDGTYSNSGAVKVYEKTTTSTSTTWVQLGVTIEGTANSQHLGRAVAMSPDGNTIFMRADGSNTHVYRWINSAWVQLGGAINHSASQYNSLSSNFDGSNIAIASDTQVEVYQYVNASWSIKGATINQESSSDYSNAVALSADGNTLAIGAYLNDGGGSDSGHVRIFGFENGAWIQLGTDIDGDGAGDHFGISVSLSADGSTLAVGARYYDTNTDNNDDRGSVQIYSRSLTETSTLWTQKGETLTGIANSDYFGSDTTLSADGNILAVGAYNSNVNSSYSGQVTLYHWKNSAWEALGSRIDGPYYSTQTGYSIALSSDGTKLVVGSPYHNSYTGYVTVYELADYQNDAPEVLNSTAILSKSSSITLLPYVNDQENDSYTITINQPSNGTAVVSNTKIIYTPNQNFAGQDYVTFQASDGNNISSVATITLNVYNFFYPEGFQVGEEIIGEAKDDYFGGSIAINDDGSIIAIGSSLNDSNGTDSGEVKIFKNTNDSWVQIGNLNGAGANSSFGTKLALNGIGNQILINGKYLYQYDETSWILSHEFNMNPTSVEIDYSGNVILFQFSSTVEVYKKYGSDWHKTDQNFTNITRSALSQDGTSLVITDGNDDTAASNTGKVTVYNLVEHTWNQTGQVLYGTDSGDNFGNVIAFSGDGKTLVVNSPNNDTAGSNYGKVTTYHKTLTSTGTINWAVDPNPLYGINSSFGNSLRMNSNGTFLIIDNILYSYHNNQWIKSTNQFYDYEAFDWSKNGSTLLFSKQSYANGSKTNSGRVWVKKMINVNNHAPVTNVLFDATPKNTPAIIHLSADDSDGDVLTYSMVSQPQNGSMNVSGTTFIYTPTQEFTGIDFFTFKATDGALESNVATVTINVYNKAILSEAGLIHQSLTGSVTSDGFGTAIATNGNGSLFIVSSPGFDQTGSVNSGKASVFINSGSQWELMDSEIFGQNAGDYFGSSVEMNQAGDIVVVGNDINDNNSSDSGVVHVYSKTISGSLILWDEVGSIEGRSYSLQYGYKVSMSASGNSIAIAGRGNVFLFENINGEWVKSSMNIEFVNISSLTMNMDGTRLAIGSSNTTGKVQVYQKSSHSWSELGSALVREGGFGKSVTFNGDGTLMAVGDPYVNSNRGQVLLYKWDNNQWSQYGSPLNGVDINENFGIQVSMNSQGTLLATGSSTSIKLYQINTTSFSYAGTINGDLGNRVKISPDGTHLFLGNYSDIGYIEVYSIADSQNDAPQVQAIVSATEKNTSSSIFLIATDPENDPITFAIASQPANGTVSLTGSYVVYTPTTDYVGTDSFTFTASDGSLTSSATTVSLTVFNSFLSTATRIGQQLDGESTSDYFGQSVATSQDGSRVVIGIYNDDGDGNYSNSGAVKVYEKTTTSTSTTWVQLGVTIEGTANSQRLGRAVAMSPDGNTIFMRADGSNTHVYRWINSAWVQLGGAINHSASQYNSLSSNFDGSNIAIASDTQVEVYQYVNASWTIKGATINQESSSDNSNAVALSADGNTLAIGAYQNDGGGSDSGHVRIFGFENGAWIQLGTDIDGDGASDYFGISVSLSADGSTLAVGARYYDTESDNNRGSVQIYSRSLTGTSTLWTQKGETLTGIANSDFFGSDTTLSADGNILAVGAYNSNVNSSSSGQVTLYHWKNSAWEALGSRINGISSTQTGYSIALSSDGTKLVVGSPYHNSYTGYVTVYELADYQNDVPQVQAIVSATEKNTSSNIFLIATDAENDPITFAIASQPANGTVSLTGSYVVYTPTTDYVGTDSFTFTASDGSLTSSATTVSLTVFNSFLSTATRIGQQLDGESTSDYFGQSVATSQDGSRVVIGIYLDDGDGTYSDSGAVKVYEKTTTSTSTTWVQLGKTIEGTANSQHLGRAVAMSPDGNTIFMRADGSNTHVYRWINSAWVQLGGAINHSASQYNSLSSNFDGSNIAIASDTQVEVYQYVNASWSIKGATINQESSSDYSNAVALSADGNTLAIGAYLNDGGGSDSGHVRIFGFENGAWIQLGTDIDGDGAGDYFGTSVSLSADGSTLAVGASYYDTNTDNDDNRGSVQIYSRSLTETSTLWTQKGETLTGIANSDYFGSDTTLSADGNILAVGAYNSDVNSSYSGQVTLYHWKNSAWEALGSRIDGPYYTQTGFSIALSSDGTKLVVGSPFHNSQTGYVTVYELADYQNDVPQVQAIVSATEKNTSSNIFLIATDAENDPITFAIASQPANGTVSLTGSYVVYTPTTDYVGTDSFTFTASDGSLTSSATTVSLTVFNSFLSAAARIGQQLDGESTSDYFGQSVATSQDGSRVVIGIYLDDGDGTIPIQGQLRCMKKQRPQLPQHGFNWA